MAYRIVCDNYPILDLRDDELIVVNPKIDLEVNKVGGGSFTIYNTHPYFDKLQRMKSIFEVSDDVGAIFRGRMTDDTIDFDNGKAVDLEGAMAFFNDSVVRPYAFPGDFLKDSGYLAAAESGNVIEFFLKWLVENHNSQVLEFQRFKVGRVTVTDPNNYLSRSNAEYASTWENLQSKLFNSSVGGYLCIRYEADGNYIDYLAKFDETNTQEIVFGENLLDLSNETSAAETYSVILPLGLTTPEGAGTGQRLTIAEYPDGDITDDIVKSGDLIYSRSAVEKYGWVCSVVKWDDVSQVINLVRKAVDQLTSGGVALQNTIEAKAIDLNFSDKEIESFRIYKNVVVRSVPHDLMAVYQLSKLSIPLLDPKSTSIVVGKTQKTLIDKQSESAIEVENKITILTQRVESTDGKVSDIQQTAGQVSVVVSDDNGALSSIVNPEEISITKTDQNGNIISGFFYDAEAGEFKFYGSGEFRASDSGAFIRIENDEIVLYAKDGVDKTRIGFISTDDDDFPYILLGQAGADGYVGLVKRFSDGVWFGNSALKDDTGKFAGKLGASGIFVNTDENKAYIVNGTEKTNLYTGEAVARFA